jgi:hypothetical protein
MENSETPKRRGRKVNPDSNRQKYLKAKAERDIVRAEKRAAREKLMQERAQRRQEREARKAARATEPKVKIEKAAQPKKEKVQA